MAEATRFKSVTKATKRRKPRTKGRIAAMRFQCALIVLMAITCATPRIADDILIAGPGARSCAEFGKD